MEPPIKRRRTSLQHESRIFLPDVNTGDGHTDMEAGIPVLPLNKPLELRSLESSSFEVRDIRPHKAVDRNLQPRAPLVTVTANVVNIAILHGSDTSSYTQIAVASTELHLPISGVGTVTIAGAVPAASQASSTSTGEPGVSSTAPPGSSATTLVPSARTSNATSIEDGTVTVTATSSLQVTLRNGTVTSSSLPSSLASLSPSSLSQSTRRRTVFTAEGFTTTIDDYSSGSTTTGFRFGDVNTAYTNLVSSATSSEALAPTSSPTSQTTSTSPVAGPSIVLTPQQQQVVGGVVGGVAGVALVLLGILYFLKWYRQHLKAQGRLPEQSSRHRQLPSGDDHEYIASHPMVQSPGPGLVPVTSLKQSLSKLRPHSAHTLTSSHTDQSSFLGPESERSFQRVSGRKIPSVLLTGGDGYGSRGPVSPVSDTFSFSRSRDVSQSSFFRDNNNPNNPFLTTNERGLAPGHDTASRSNVSHFVDIPLEDNSFPSPPRAKTSTQTRDFAALNASKSRLSIQTGSMTAFNPDRHGDAGVTIRPSPARTPTTTSPTTSSLRLPMHTPPLMHGDAPEMPPLHPWRVAMGARTFSDDGLSVQRSLGQRSMSGISVRSSGSVGGKFREEI